MIISSVYPTLFLCIIFNCLYKVPHHNYLPFLSAVPTHYCRFCVLCASNREICCSLGWATPGLPSCYLPYSHASFPSLVRCHLLPKTLCDCSQCHHSQNPRLIHLLHYFYSKPHNSVYNINYCHFNFNVMFGISKQNSLNDLKSILRMFTLLPSTGVSMECNFYSWFIIHKIPDFQFLYSMYITRQHSI